MKKYRQKSEEIEAVQITDATFDDPHPNPEHLPGVVYDPVKREAIVPALIGNIGAKAGDWIVADGNGLYEVWTNEKFTSNYEPA